MKEELQALRWESYEEVRQGFLLMADPLRAKMKGTGHLDLGSHGAVYDRETSEMESFSRLIWGIAPFLTQNEDGFLQNQLLMGLTVGADPTSPHYFGQLSDYHQKFVEMASIAISLLLAKEKTWDNLSEESKVNLSNWLLQINDHKIPKNNWRFFRILVNIAMKKMSQSYSQEMIEADFKLIESCYAGNGWYFDGKKTQFDYYIPWAFHFYSLIYVKFMREEEPERTGKMIERAILFARDYQYWFAKNGVAVPFGRSLTYRFAQSAFWAALIFADVEALPWGVIKGLFARNMEYWMQQEIFDESGFLNTGYHYQNLNMAEGYNAPGSPYWAFKSFLLLAVKKDHPYWKSVLFQTNFSTDRLVSKTSHSLIEHVNLSEQVFFYPAGQYVSDQSHAAAKYGKFVYSTHYGFSIPKASESYAQGAFDNVLALSEDGEYFRSKGRVIACDIQEDRVIHYWQPMKNIQIKSTIIPCGQAHIRVHEIQSGCDLLVYDGGFSAPLDNDRVEQLNLLEQMNNLKCSTVAKNIYGFDQVEIIRPEANTNLFFQRTFFPSLRANLGKGEHLLVGLFAGILKNDTVPFPTVAFRGNQIEISLQTREKITVEVGVKNFQTI